MSPDISFVVITGGPCAGKSTAMAKFTELLQKSGYRVINLSEGATELIMAGFPPTTPGFQVHLLNFLHMRYAHYYHMIRTTYDGRPTVILCDRGILDAKAYMSADEWDKLLQELGLSESELMARYSLVIHLVTAANGAESFYTLSNNSARDESPAKARELDERTIEAWLTHPHHFVVDNRTAFAEKINRAVAHFARVLNMPQPTEIERKFLIKNFAPDMIPSKAVTLSIVQHYLTEMPGVSERRVRATTTEKGETSYFYTEKDVTSDPMVRLEREKRISRSEYEELLLQRHPKLGVIEKTRHVFVYKGKRFELDVFASSKLKDDGKNLVLLEVELGSTDEDIVIPLSLSPFMEEVTKDKNYRNRTLAEKA